VWRRRSSEETVDLPLTLTSRGEKNGVLQNDKFLREILPKIPKSILNRKDVQYALTYDVKLTLFRVGEAVEAENVDNPVPESREASE